MKIKSIIPISQRENCRCYFCGETRSVKYTTEIVHPVDNSLLEVKCCNRCILREPCKYHLDIPTVGLCCEAYYKAKRKDNREWMHFPFCSEENCPLKHPELLKGATLEEEDKANEDLLV